MTFGPVDSKTSFLSTAETFPQDQSQLLVKMTSVHSDIANCVNIREIAQYEDDQQLLTGQQFSTPGNPILKKYVFRKMLYIGAYAAGATYNIPHGITGLVQFTHIYGTCVTDAVDYRPIPYTSAIAVANQTSIRVDNAGNIILGVGAGSPNITSGIIVLEYLLN